jgi:hypothetical protein
MTMIDIGCWERGCACYDSRIPTETVEVVRRDWVSLTDEDIEQEFGFIDELLRDCVQRTEAKLKERNT